MPGLHMGLISSNYQCLEQTIQLILKLTLSRHKLALITGILFCKSTVVCFCLYRHCFNFCLLYIIIRLGCKFVVDGINENHEN